MGGKTLVDDRNGFNKLSCLEILWTVRHLWLEEARFTFNLYKHWAQLILTHPGGALVMLLNQ